VKRLVTVTIPSIALACVIGALAVEAWVRLSWDPARGRPGFTVADPVRLEKLAPNYDGWFAGVPVRTNALGFRDDRDYSLDKAPGTFRIIILGDSVTFGHGSVAEHAYPRLLEDRLKAWKPQVHWQVWNLGVPGYNTSQELAYLREVGPAYRPDLVIIGFYGNDVVDNREVTQATRTAIASAAVKTWLKRHLYSFEFYKRAALTLEYRLRASPAERATLENLAAQDRLLARPSNAADMKEQQLTSPTPMPAAERAAHPCTGKEEPWMQLLLRTPGLDVWKETIGRLQRLNRDGTYRIAFFINHAPDFCTNDDVFDTRASKPVDDFYLKVMSDGTPAVSTHDEFAKYRPSQMPEAGGHSIGNSNALKADVLFAFLRDRVLPAL
jgi:lysophospholipase L1-like esterase